MKRKNIKKVTNNYICHYTSTQNQCLELLTFISMNAIITRKELNENIDLLFKGGYNKYQFGYLACKYSQLIGMIPSKLNIGYEFINKNKLNQTIIDKMTEQYENEKYSEIEDNFKVIKHIAVEDEVYGTYLISVYDYEKYIK